MPCTIADFISVLEKIAPVTLAESWDHVGLQIGASEAAMTGVLVALDVTPEAIECARQQKLNTLLVHHPLFFKPLHQLVFDTPFAAMVRQAIVGNLNVVVAHTNYDSAPGGLNDELAQALGLQKIRPLRSASSGLRDAGLGRVGVLSQAVSLKAFLETVRKTFSLVGLRRVGNAKSKIKTVALCGGSGAFLIDAARQAGAEVFLTGDVKYHDAFDARLHGDVGPVILDAGHFSLEQYAMRQLAKRLDAQAKKKGWKIPVVFFDQACDPFHFGTDC